MTICDKCGKEILTHGKRLSLPYVYACKAWQEKTFDLCGGCASKLNNAIDKAKADFINGGADNEQREAENKSSNKYYGEPGIKLCKKWLEGRVIKIQGESKMQDREKQIEEMANDLAQHCPDLVENCCGASSCVSCLTRFLYEAGYRKQSEGKWQKHGNEKTCSLCKFIYYSNNDEWNFCPNCGAKMKGGGE